MNLEMRNILSIFFFGAFIVNGLFAQELSDEELMGIDSFRVHLEESGIFKALKADKKNCEYFALLMKNSKLSSEEKKSAQKIYEEAKNNYDLLIEGIIKEMQASRSPGAAIAVFIEKGGKNGDFNQIAARANRKAQDFQRLAMDRLGIDGAGSLVEWIDRILTNLMPPWMQKISNVAFDLVKGMLIRKMEGMKFDGWDELR